MEALVGLGSHLEAERIASRVIQWLAGSRPLGSGTEAPASWLAGCPLGVVLSLWRLDAFLSTLPPLFLQQPPPSALPVLLLLMTSLLLFISRSRTAECAAFKGSQDPTRPTRISQGHLPVQGQPICAMNTSAESLCPQPQYSHGSNTGFSTSWGTKS